MNLDDQMAEAVRRQREHVVSSMHVDRRGWTRQQWVDDARKLMGDLDGSVLDLVNGHVGALLGQIDDLQRRIDAVLRIADVLEDMGRGAREPLTPEARVVAKTNISAARIIRAALTTDPQEIMMNDDTRVDYEKTFAAESFVDEEPDSTLVQYARHELALIGEEESVINGIVHVVQAFADMDDSGFMAAYIIQRLELLLRFKPLSALTNDPNEWIDQTESSGGTATWQSRRNPEAFSNDWGITYYLLSELEAAGSLELTPMHRTESHDQETHDE
jgi:hypothetical protein